MAASNLGVAGFNEGTKCLTWAKHARGTGKPFAKGRARWISISSLSGLEVHTDVEKLRASRKLQIKPGRIDSIEAHLDESKEEGGGAAAGAPGAKKKGGGGFLGKLRGKLGSAKPAKFEPYFVVKLKDGTAHGFSIYKKGDRVPMAACVAEAQRCIDALNEICATIGESELASEVAAGSFVLEKILADMEKCRERKARALKAIDAWEKATLNCEVPFIAKKPEGGSILLRRSGATIHDPAGDDNPPAVQIGTGLATLHLLTWEKTDPAEEGAGADSYDICVELVRINNAGDMVAADHPLFSTIVQNNSPDVTFRVNAKTARLESDIHLGAMISGKIEDAFATIGLSVEIDADPVKHAGSCAQQAVDLSIRWEWLVEWALLVGVEKLPPVEGGYAANHQDLVDWTGHVVTQGMFIGMVQAMAENSDSSNDDDADYDADFIRAIEQLGLETTNDKFSYTSSKIDGAVKSLLVSRFMTASRTIHGKVRASSTEQLSLHRHVFVYYPGDVSSKLFTADDEVWAAHEEKEDFDLPDEFAKPLTETVQRSLNVMNMDHKLAAEADVTPQLMAALSIALFSSADADGNGEIDRSEVDAMFKALGIKIADGFLDKFMAAFDTNNDGVLDIDEFAELTRRLMSGFNTVEGLSPSSLAHLKLETANVKVDEQEISVRVGAEAASAAAGSKAENADQDRGETGTVMDVSFDAMDRMIIGSDPEDGEQLFKAKITARDTVEIPAGDDRTVVIRLRPEAPMPRRKKKAGEEIRIITMSLPDAGQASRWHRALQGVIKFVDSATAGGDPQLEGIQYSGLAEHLLSGAGGAVNLPKGVFGVSKPLFPIE